MKKRNEPRKPARSQPFLEPKKRILVACEGEITEKEYLEQFRNRIKNNLISISVVHDGSSPISVVRKAKADRDTAESHAQLENEPYLKFDSTWAVFDMDDHTSVGDAFEMARDNNISIAISNPCIELWLFLHFQDQPGMRHRHIVQRLLKKHIPDYDKHIDIDKFLPGYASAVSRAKKLETEAKSTGDCHKKNPYTDLYKLTELIRDEKDLPLIPSDKNRKPTKSVKSASKAKKFK